MKAIPSQPHRFYLDTDVDLPAGAMPIVLTSDGRSITGLRFGTSADHKAWLEGAEPCPAAVSLSAPTVGAGAGPAAADLLSRAARQLAEYGAGVREAFDLPLELAGTEFQRAVWSQLLNIPFGRTTTYGAVAAAIGRPGQARAVGAAVGANPIGVIIPCHRVIGADGSLTGFAGGLANKIALLTREGVSAL